MARILVSYYKVQEVSLQMVQCFWDGFIKELERFGNQVFYINTAYFNSYQSNYVENRVLNDLLLKKAIEFDPEIMIAFNHRIPESFLETFDIPVIIWDGDALEYFSDLPYIKNNISRYKLFTITKGWIQGYLDFGFKKEQIFYVPQATAISSMDIEKTMQVSFLGIRKYSNQKYSNFMKQHICLDEFTEINRKFMKDGDYGLIEENVDLFAHKYPELEINREDLYPLFDKRWLDLSNMLDLGLVIAGHEGRWEDIAEFMPQLSACYTPRLVWTLNQNNLFYNESVVSLCPNHPQGLGKAFAWRAFDIMASNACILSSQSEELREMTKDYLDIPMYQSPWEARELCKKLLKDEKYRNDIIRASQRYVDENARWEHRFKDMEEILGIPVLNERNSETATAEAQDMLLDNQEIRKIVTVNSRQGAGNTDSLQEKLGRLFRRIIYKQSRIDSILKMIITGMILVVSGIIIRKDVEIPLIYMIGCGLRYIGYILMAVSILFMIVNIYYKLKRFLQRYMHKSA